MFKLYYVMYLIHDVICKLCCVMYKLYGVLYELYMMRPLQLIMYQLYVRKLFYMMWINRPSENKCIAYEILFAGTQY